MKIKFEVKATKTAPSPLLTIYLEHQGEELVDFQVMRHRTEQLQFDTHQNAVPSATRLEEPIPDGKFTMSKPNLKKFINALQLLVKS